MRLTRACLLLGLSIGLLAAPPAVAEPAAIATAPAPPVHRLTLDALLARARTFPRVIAARQAAAAARARVDEARLAWLPHLEITATGGPTSAIRCHDELGSENPAHCISTEPSEATVGFENAFFHIEGTATSPLYTFGKLSAARAAAGAGATAADDMARAAETDTVLDAARAYYGVKLGRELEYMLDDGADILDGELKRVEENLEQGKGEVTETDRFRLRAVRAEIDARRSEATRLADTALAALRMLADDPADDVDDAPLEILDIPFGSEDAAIAMAARDRPEAAAADAGARAVASLAQVEARRRWPDVVVIARGVLARANAVDDPANAFYNDPYNATSGAIGLALRWTYDLGVREARISGARAQAAQARATADAATRGLALEAAKAWVEARDARDRLAAAERGQKAARAWVAATLQATAAGLADPKDLADALVMQFSMQGRAVQATFDYNVAVLALARAEGRRPEWIQAAVRPRR